MLLEHISYFCIMEFVYLTDDEKTILLKSLDAEEKTSLSFTVSILQKMAGIYMTKGHPHPEMCDLYRKISGILSDIDLKVNKN